MEHHEIILEAIEKNLTTGKILIPSANLSKPQSLNSYSQLGEEIAVQIKGYFYGSKKLYNIEFDFDIPTSPWQYFKQSYFPKLLLNIFPVRFKSIKKTKVISAEVLFPEIPFSMLNYKYKLTVISNKS